MDWILLGAVAGPVVLVLLLVALNRWFSGWKTNILGTVAVILGALQTMDLTFLPQDASSALLTGSGIATLIVSQNTKRATT